MCSHMLVAKWEPQVCFSHFTPKGQHQAAVSHISYDHAAFPSVRLTLPTQSSRTRFPASTPSIKGPRPTESPRLLSVALPAENLRPDRPLVLSRLSRFAPMNAKTARP